MKSVVFSGIKWEKCDDNQSSQLAEEDCGLCRFSSVRGKSNDLSVVNGHSIVTSGRIGSLPCLVFKRCKHSKQLIDLSQNDFFQTFLDV